MSDLLNDQDEFDHIVKNKPYRWEFLEEFGKGWKSGKNPGNLNAFDIDKKLQFFLSFIQRDLAVIEQDQRELKLFAFYLGLLAGIFRYSSEEHPNYAFVQICHSSKTIVEIIFSLKERGYRPYYLALRKIIIDWSDIEKKGINALDEHRLKQVHSIFSAL